MTAHNAFLERRLTVRQAARLVGRAESTIRNWMAEGRLIRLDDGGPGVRAELRTGDVLAVDRSVRGRGRPPAAKPQRDPLDTGRHFGQDHLRFEESAPADFLPADLDPTVRAADPGGMAVDDLRLV